MPEPWEGCGVGSVSHLGTGGVSEAEDHFATCAATAIRARSADCDDYMVNTGDLADAIRSHLIVQIQYASDVRGGTRTVHPHALFRTTSGGLCLGAVQVGGQSKSGHLPAWKQFHLLRITSLRVLDARFVPDPDFDPESAKYRCGLLVAA